MTIDNSQNQGSNDAAETSGRAPDDNSASPSLSSHNLIDEGQYGSNAGIIGQALQTVYQQTLEEKLPDDFMKLLDQLK